MIFSTETDERETAEIPSIVFYRYKDPYIFSYYNTKPIKCKFIAYKETPKGYWIVPFHDYNFRTSEVNTRAKKWIKKPSEYDRTKRKRFAYRLEGDALYSYYRKKMEHLRHLENKCEQIKRIIKKVDDAMTKDKTEEHVKKYKLISLSDFIKKYKPISKCKLPTNWGTSDLISLDVELNNRNYHWYINSKMKKMFGKTHLFKRKHWTSNDNYTHISVDNLYNWEFHEDWFEKNNIYREDFIDEKDFIL
jgi:hypothetical protein